ncbi:5-carboxymethyl-2-hydroxymuconate Delta-isomerase [Pseudoalteromonas sp. MM17-2]|uniref:5-carboxymethyl-2-hydroxymuconate Delta-isomerase n=1 Tax=Pseudoalteromonas sp. MM17-2 TaxID=2917753 RepID=UPI001EF480AF|nr:5-carboxymethyl-2-hydroxymuconate Delta-isomerase [Pseudoalteromonas sp. MM17-2]MCG7543649.1 5-carboxymethyl-2-hydroxymuconate Delta-isomerase [Pseudoalteromonas sp. MM17-2]
MPHIVVEHSEDLPVLPQVLVEKVHQATFSSGLFELDAIKTRAIAYRHYQLGENKEGFIHICAYIMAGRSPIQKQQLSNHLLECLRTYCRESDCLSVDVRDLEPDIYCKG